MPPKSNKSRTFAQVMKLAAKDSRGLRALSEQSGIGRERIRRWVAGEEPSAIAELERLASALGLEIVVKGASRGA